jgi:hypothetical protein
MHTYNIETTISTEGELHLDHLPFHTGEKVSVIISTPNGDDDSDQKEEYKAFMAGYADEDSVYDNLQ